MSDPETTYPIKNILDSKNYLILFFAYGDGNFITVYSKAESKSRTFRFDDNDKRNHLFHPTMNFTSLDNTMLIEINIEYLREIANELPVDYLKETKVDSLLDNDAIDENSNPVILTYQLNESYLDSVFYEKDSSGKKNSRKYGRRFSTMPFQSMSFVITSQYRNKTIHKP